MGFFNLRDTKNAHYIITKCNLLKAIFFWVSFSFIYIHTKKMHLSHRDTKQNVICSVSYTFCNSETVKKLHFLIIYLHKTKKYFQMQYKKTTQNDKTTTDNDTFNRNRQKLKNAFIFFCYTITFRSENLKYCVNWKYLKKSAISNWSVYPPYVETCHANKCVKCILSVILARRPNMRDLMLFILFW